MNCSSKVLFVCLGNICRSPAAENIFRHLVHEAGLDEKVTCDSAGTIGIQSGKSPDPRMSQVLRDRGYPVDGTARMITPADLKNFDLIVTMDRQNKADVLSLTRDGEEAAKVRSLTDFCRHHSESGVPDPYEGDEEDFLFAVELIEDGVHGLFDEIESKLTPA